MKGQENIMNNSTKRTTLFLTLFLLLIISCSVAFAENIVKLDETVYVRLNDHYVYNEEYGIYQNTSTETTLFTDVEQNQGIDLDILKETYRSDGFTVITDNIDSLGTVIKAMKKDSSTNVVVTGVVFISPMDNVIILIIGYYDTTAGNNDKDAILNSIKVVSAPSSGIVDYVTRCYNIILQRSPDASGLNYWANALQNGSKAAANIIDDFVNSQEFKSRNLSNAEKVIILYMTMLNRAPDTAGLSYWVNNLNQGQPLAAIINGFCNAPEFISICNSYGIKPGSVTVPDTQAAGKRAKIEAFVTRCYSIILGRQPDAAGLNHWANSLESGAQAASNIIDDFINSAEFRNRRLSNAATIEILYKTMLNRAPDAAGIAYWESLLNQGQPFAVIINGFCGSAEFTAICNEYGIKPGSVAVKGASEYVTPEPEEAPIAETPVVPEEAPVAEEQPTTEEPVIEEPVIEEPPVEPAAAEEPVVEQTADPVTEEDPVVEEQPVPENNDPVVDAEPAADPEPVVDAQPAAEEQPAVEAEPAEAQPASDNTEPVVEETVVE